MWQHVFQAVVCGTFKLSVRLYYQDIIVPREVSHETRKVKGAKYSQVMNRDVKSIRLNKLTQSVTFCECPHTNYPD